jgi:hypothetical protein
MQGRVLGMRKLRPLSSEYSMSAVPSIPGINPGDRHVRFAPILLI